MKRLSLIKKILPLCVSLMISVPVMAQPLSLEAYAEEVYATQNLLSEKEKESLIKEFAISSNYLEDDVEEDVELSYQEYSDRLLLAYNYYLDLIAETRSR